MQMFTGFSAVVAGAEWNSVVFCTQCCSISGPCAASPCCAPHPTLLSSCISGPCGPVSCGGWFYPLTYWYLVGNVSIVGGLTYGFSKCWSWGLPAEDISQFCDTKKTDLLKKLSVFQKTKSSNNNDNDNFDEEKKCLRK